MGGMDDYKPAMAMIGVQCTYAVVALTTRDAMLNGMSPSVFVLYRQAVATLVIVPIAYFCTWRKESVKCSMGFRSFWLIFVTSLIGVTMNQNLYFEGIYLASSSMASAMNNMTPAITFLFAFILGLETIKIGQVRSIAKIVETGLCVGGATVMTLPRGPELLSTPFPRMFHSFLGSTTQTWLIGCAFLFTSCCRWAVWLILRVTVTESYPDHMSLSAWMCFMATLQSAVVALCLEHNLSAWKLFSTMDIVSFVVAGVGASAIAFFLQTWCVSVKGPVFTAIFNPVCTIVTTVLAAIVLKEDIYLGSLIGAVVVIIGLYTVLWGKAEDQQQKNGDSVSNEGLHESPSVQVLVDDPADEQKEPLLTN